MQFSFSRENFIKKYHEALQHARLSNQFAILPSQNISLQDYIIFFKFPLNLNEIQKYTNEIKTFEMNELISIHEPIECENLINTGKIDEVERQHIENFDFHLLNFNFDIRQKQDLKIKSVTLNVVLNEFELPHLKPRVVSLFPTSDIFKNKKNVSGKIHISGGNGIKFIENNSISENKTDNQFIDFIYDYEATYESLFSTITGSGFFYKFELPHTSPSTHSFKINAIFLRPRIIKNILLKASITINDFLVEYYYVTEVPIIESNF